MNPVPLISMSIPPERNPRFALDLFINCRPVMRGIPYDRGMNYPNYGYHAMLQFYPPLPAPKIPMNPS